MISPKIVVWFSCGVASAVAAKKTIEQYSDKYEIHIVNNPVAEEDKDNKRFLLDIQKWINYDIETAINPNFPSCSAIEVWGKRKFMSSPYGAPCTSELKKNARHEYERNNKIDWHVLGFTYDEEKRHQRFILTERKNVLPVLIDLKLTKKDCFKIINKAGISLPRVYEMGYPNANCIGCVKATSPTYWNLVREKHPEVFKQRSEQSREIGCKLVRVKGERKYLDELLVTDTGRPLKDFSFECGSFCEEWNPNKELESQTND
ncbi:MAG TPA: hypothetical protein VMX17_12495 [Candidatus Glassbacteria bacterium]|nr:hypothetical protein [Candidatus Glassbacteria bacterium]